MKICLLIQNLVSCCNVCSSNIRSRYTSNLLLCLLRILLEQTLYVRNYGRLASVLTTLIYLTQYEVNYKNSYDVCACYAA